MSDFDIGIAFAYANKRKRTRLEKNTLYRREVRSKVYYHLHDNELSDIDSSVMKDLVSIKLKDSDEKHFNAPDVQSSLKLSISTNEQIEANDNESASYSDIFEQFNDDLSNQEINNSSLHPYTSISSISFSQNLIDFFRKANISKFHVERLINLIKSALPQPNTLPTNYTELLNTLSVEDIFNKRVVCVNCKIDLSITSNKCTKCANNKPQGVVVIFDALQQKIFSQIYDRLVPIINSYRESIREEKDHNDNYKLLCESTNKPFISLLLHIDGIGLGESTKQSLWILNCSIVELPPIYRNRRQNNIILSMWIGYEQPDIDLWLSHSINQLMTLKSPGFPTREGHQMMIKVYGIIADCPAMSLILNHISHVGYYCCWFCKIKGEHVLKKRQYYYEENFLMRDRLDFDFNSRTAQYLQQNINGRLGISILDKIMDIPLPRCIIADYLHVTLLRHTKTICRYIYTNILKPKQRSLLDQRILSQRFPHFFNRTIRTFNDTRVKASEMRNLLLYCVLPMVRNLLDSEQAAHLGLFVVGIRLLHGRRNFADKTADQAHELLTAFYRDHEMFYQSKQNYVLHLHTHYYELYRNHGSLCNINTFSQEDIMGAVSKYKHGSRFWSDQLAFYLNIDFALNNTKQYEESVSLNSTHIGVFDESHIPNELIQIITNIHSRICNCDDTKNCIHFFRRFRNKKQVVYHSLSYTKRQSSVSYFVKYGACFGIIVTFLYCNGKQYAVIKHHPIKKLFSDDFITSNYYDLLLKSIDEFFFVLEKVSSRFGVVDVDNFVEIGIVLEEDNCLIVSPVSAYHEHG